MLESLFSWNDENASADDYLEIKDQDLESLVSDLTDSIVYRIVEDRKRVAKQPWAIAHYRFNLLGSMPRFSLENKIPETQIPGMQYRII